MTTYHQISRRFEESPLLAFKDELQIDPNLEQKQKKAHAYVPSAADNKVTKVGAETFKAAADAEQTAEKFFEEKITDFASKTAVQKKQEKFPLVVDERVADVGTETLPEAPATRTQETSPTEAVVPKTIIEIEMDAILTAYEKELAKGDAADPSYLYDLACQMLGYLMRNAERDDQEQIQQLTKRINSQVVDVQATYHNGMAITFGVISAVASIAAGFCGLSPIFGARLFLAAETTKTLANASTSVSAIGGAFQMFEKISDNGKMGERTGRNHLLEESKERRSGRQNAKSDKKHQEQTSVSSLADGHKSKSQAVQSLINQ
jgi:hypothetical protein